MLHLAAAVRDGDDVLGQLVEDTRRDGGTALTGRLEPGLEGPLQTRMAVLGLARKPVIHTHDHEIRAAISTEEALLTQLDGEWYAT